MATRTIETKAIISAEDRTGPAFAAVVQHLAKMEDAARRATAHVKRASAADDIEDRIRHQVRYDHHRRLTEERAARREELVHLREVERLETKMQARRAAIGLAGGFAAHEAAHFAHRSFDTYREFDKERRFGKAVMGISDEDQAALVRQAIHMGATTKFNDIQVLEAQRELAARGLKKEAILGMMDPAGDLGQSLGLTLPEAVKQLEGAIFRFKKNVDTTGDAMAAARQTADLQVRAAKFSGMTPDDIRELYKYGATPARMSGVSEQFLLAFGGISKKANIGGDEAGVAFRALISAGQSPTRGAKEALLANGLDYSKYQSKISSIPVEPFVKNVAAQYGVALNRKAITALNKVFSDPALLNDSSKFTPAVNSVLGGALGGKDAKSLKSIAGMANRFRNASGGGSDVNAFLLDLMTKLPGNIKLANALFGSKQGGRIANALGDPETLKTMRQLLTEHSEGYAKKIADERMGGFDGAVSRFEGATKNLETALGRAFDAGGKGGLLTGIADGAGRLVQSLAEAPPQLQRLAAEAGLAAGAFAGLKGAESILGGFGLKTSASALDHAALALEGAAVKLGGASGVKDLLPGGSGNPKKGIGGRAMKVVKSLPLIGSLLLGADEFIDYMDEEHRREFGVPLGANPPVRHGRQMGGNAHADTLRPRGSLSPSSLTPIGGFGASLPTFAQKVDVFLAQPPSLRVEVTAGSTLLSIVQDIKDIKLQLRARADTGPGGLGETATGQN